MNIELLRSTAKALVAPHKGILASDDQPSSNAKHFEAVGLESTPETRRDYRMTLYSSPAATETLSGIIMHDETFWQQTAEGQPIPQYIASRGILPGIKVDQGLVDFPGFPGEKLVRGLDDLPERLEKYAAAGARFAKWRGVVTINETAPTRAQVESLAYILARYARLCQEFDIVPIVEPEILFEGNHSLKTCRVISGMVWDTTIDYLHQHRVDIGGIIIKTSMILPGKDSGEEVALEEIARVNAEALRTHFPAELGGLVFLSGGQTPIQAAINLNRIVQAGPYPWGLTFSFLRSIQHPVLQYYAAHPGDIAGAHAVCDAMLRQTAAAASGTLDESTVQGDAVVAGDKHNSY